MGSSSTPVSVRGDISLLIEKRLEALEKGFRQNIGIIGLPGSGKTHFLSRVFHSISANPRFIPIYVHAGALDFEDLADRWAGAILSGLFLSQGVSAPQNFQSLLLAADPIIPKTTERIRFIKKHLHREKPSLLCKELFALTEILSQETGKKLILMIDEFDQLERLDASDPFALLGKEIMVQKSTLYMAASSSPMKAKEVFKEKLSMLFGNFEVLDMVSFDFEESAQFLAMRFPDLHFSAEQKEFLIRLTDGKPDYLELILDQLENGLAHQVLRETSFAKDASGTLFSGHLVDAFIRELTPPFGRLYYLFEKKMDRFRRGKKDGASFLRILLAIGRGRCRLNAVSAAAGLKISETKKILSRFEESDLIVRRGSFYALEDPLFRFWLCEYFERECQRYQPDADPFYQDMRGALKREMESIEACGAMSFTFRIERLLKEFRGDVVEIGGKKIHCPQFSEVLPRSLDGGGVAFAAKGTKGKWYCHFYEQKVTEEDVAVFQSELKKFRRKPQGRILMMLRGIEQNAKLMAQQEGLQLWDLRLINQVLDLFGLPKMILFAEKEFYGPPLGTLAQNVYSA